MVFPRKRLDYGDGAFVHADTGGFQQSPLTGEQTGVVVADQLAVDHEQHLIRPIGDVFGVLLGDDDRHRAGLANAFQRIENLLTSLGVKRRRRLIEDQHIGFGRERRRDGDALHLPAGQTGGHALAVSGHADQIEHDVDLMVNDLRVHAPVLQRECDFVLDRGAEQLGFGVLLHIADAFRQRGYGMMAGVHSVDFHRAGHRAIRQIRDDARQSHAQCGFARAGRPDDADE